jgi:hypothetical protein
LLVEKSNVDRSIGYVTHLVFTKEEFYALC